MFRHVNYSVNNNESNNNNNNNRDVMLNVVGISNYTDMNQLWNII